MSDTQDPNAAPTTGGNPATGEPPAPAPAPPAAPLPAAGEPTGGTQEPDWERKFKGLQAVHQNLQEQLKGVVAEKDTFAAQLTELQGTVESLRGEIGSLNTTKDESVANLQQIQGELVDYKLWERKVARLRTTAPHLAQFEKFILVDLSDELLVADPATLSEEQAGQLDAAIDKAIQEFATTMGAYVEAAQRSAAAGVVPPTSPGRGGEPNLSLEQLYELAISKAGTDEYDKLMEQFQKHLAQEEGAKDEDGYWRPRTHQMPMT
jgi:TolA-binding protein